MTTNSIKYLAHIHELLDRHFDLEEFRTLCFELGVDADSLGGEGKSARMRELVRVLVRNGRLPHLITLAQRKRSHVTWPPVPPNFQSASSSSEDAPTLRGNQVNVYGDYIQGNKVSGDQVGGDQINVGDINDSKGVAIGRGAKAEVHIQQELKGDEVNQVHRIISTGFSTENQPDIPILSTMPLAVETDYIFWFEVGEKAVGSIEKMDKVLDVEKLPPKSQLDVVLFAFEGEIHILNVAAVGHLKVMEDKQVFVAKQAYLPANLSQESELINRRLFFPVKTPPQPGIYRLRCHIYFQYTLIQSRLITVKVMQKSVPQNEPMLVSETDYVLSRTFEYEQLQGMGHNRLSIMLNSNEDGTHTFRFYGEEIEGRSFKQDSSFSASALQDMISYMRESMRQASWGDTEPFKWGKEYRYNDPINFRNLQSDLIRFALRGYRFYDRFINRLAGNSDRVVQLQQLMKIPGQIQIALKEFVSHVIPVAMVYDYPLNDGLRTVEYSLCSAFLNSLKQDAHLEDTMCFQGNCPNYGNETVVCPSGFWGYRHYIGLPVSISTSLEAPSIITYSTLPQLIVNVSTDKNFVKRRAHEITLQTMGTGWVYADTLEKAVDALKIAKPHVVYFYCHGGLDDRLPYLVLGSNDSDRFTRALLRTKGIRWQRPRPLVFINGCHTTALEPEKALDLVTGFVETSQAAGVIGTEITIFEEMAVPFAEECFRRFLLKGETIGQAVHGARLKLLKDGNPLGLVYIPYVMPGLHLVKETNG